MVLATAPSSLSNLGRDACVTFNTFKAIMIGIAGPSTDPKKETGIIQRTKLGSAVKGACCEGSLL
jgi:hypothetical protein